MGNAMSEDLWSAIDRPYTPRPFATPHGEGDQVARRQEFIQRRRAAGQCQDCPKLTGVNPKTGKPYWRCEYHRLAQARRRRYAT